MPVFRVIGYTDPRQKCSLTQKSKASLSHLNNSMVWIQFFNFLIENNFSCSSFNEKNMILLWNVGFWVDKHYCLGSVCMCVRTTSKFLIPRNCLSLLENGQWIYHYEWPSVTIQNKRFFKTSVIINPPWGLFINHVVKFLTPSPFVVTFTK